MRGTPRRVFGLGLEALPAQGEDAASGYTGLLYS